MSVRAEWCGACDLYVFNTAQGVVLKGLSEQAMTPQKKEGDGFPDSCHNYEGGVRPGCVLTYNLDGADLEEEFP